jgi:hypothetical protein
MIRASLALAAIVLAALVARRFRRDVAAWAPYDGEDWLSYRDTYTDRLAGHSLLLVGHDEATGMAVLRDPNA